MIIKNILEGKDRLRVVTNRKCQEDPSIECIELRGHFGGETYQMLQRSLSSVSSAINKIYI